MRTERKKKLEKKSKSSGAVAEKLLVVMGPLGSAGTVASDVLVGPVVPYRHWNLLRIGEKAERKWLVCLTLVFSAVSECEVLL